MPALARALPFALALAFLSGVSGLAGGRPVSAAPYEIFGLGPRGSALAGAMTSIADDFSASFYNPAGAAEAQGVEVNLGAVFTAQDIEATGQGKETQKDAGGFAGISFPIPLGGVLANRLFHSNGMVLYTGDTELMKISLTSADKPFFVPYTNANERVILAPAFAARLTSWLSIGAGVNIFTFDSRNVVNTSIGPAGELEMEGSLDLMTEIVPKAGLLLKLGTLRPGLADFRVGFAYRAAIEQSFRLPMQVDVGFPMEITIWGSELLAPEEFVLGVSAEPVPAMTVSLDLSLSRWSAYPSPRMAVRMAGIEDLLPVPSLSEALFVPADPGLDDTFSPRLGVEYRGIDTPAGLLTLRAGYRYEPSAGPANPEDPLLFTNARHIAAAGLAFTPRVEFLRETGLAVDLEMYVQGHFLESEKRDVPAGLSESGEPVTTTAKGQVLSGGFGLSLGL